MSKLRCFLEYQEKELENGYENEHENDYNYQNYGQNRPMQLLENLNSKLEEGTEYQKKC